MEKIRIRKATEKDRGEIAFVFADAFSNDWKILSSDTTKVARALEKGHVISTYIVAISHDRIVGVLALVTDEQRAFNIPLKEFQKAFGFFKGYMIGSALKHDMEKVISLNKHCAYIDILGVCKEFQHKGIASSLLDYVFVNYEYSSYLLSLTNKNDKASSLYKKKGFHEIRREKVKFAKQKGFSEYIYLEYKK